MTYDEPEIARGYMTLMKREYDRTLRLLRVGKASRKDLERACIAWNCAITSYELARVAWTQTPTEEETT